MSGSRLKICATGVAAWPSEKRLKATGSVQPASGDAVQFSPVDKTSNGSF
jgi:hypothetical protein